MALGFAATFDLVVALSALLLAFFFTARGFLTGAASSVVAAATLDRVFLATTFAGSVVSAAARGFLGARGFFAGASSALAVEVGALSAEVGDSFAFAGGVVLASGG